MNKGAETAEALIAQMESVLHKLIANAKQLNETVLHSFSEDDLLTLQSEQTELMDQLVEVDESVNKACNNNLKKANVAAWGRIQDQLDDFEALNNEFINNLSLRAGVIQFDKNDE
jgi:hypothetical protein